MKTEINKNCVYNMKQKRIWKKALKGIKEREREQLAKFLLGAKPRENKL